MFNRATTCSGVLPELVAPQHRRVADGLQRPLLRRSRFRQQMTPDVDMICIATACAKMASNPRLLAQALSKSSDFLICM
jgi:hypothetical protein